MGKKKSVTEVGETVPKNLKFGIIVTVAIFWAEFLRSALKEFFYIFLKNYMIVITDLILAVMATLAGYFVLLGYRKIISGLKKLKV